MPRADRFSGSAGLSATPVHGRIYVDHASTTPIAPEVLEAMLPHLGERFGNASSPYARGLQAREAVERARGSVAALLALPADEVTFTSSASESNNLALKGIALAAGTRSRSLLAAASEHISILHPLRTLERQGFRVRLLPVDRDGSLDPEDLRRALTDDTLLVSVAHASAEIGTLQPLSDLCRVAHVRGVPLHCDATLTAGVLPWPSGPDSPDLVTLTAHLLYGPQGIAALRVRPGLRLAPLIEGGSQEGGLRAGTEPVAAMAGFGAAARLALAERERRAARSGALADRLRREVCKRIDGLLLTGHPERRVPGHLSLCVRNADAEALLRALDAEGIEAASGSACTTTVRKPSHVLEAIGLDPVTARGALTFSFGETNRDTDPERVADVLLRAVTRLRALSPLSRPS
jgi:cysteine desulfurase